MKKYLAEFFGTFVIVLFGCGSAALTGGITGVLGILGIAMAFGLSIVAMAYAIGDVSGCHINPAVSLAMFVSGRMSVKDFVGYIIAQFCGGIAGAGLLFAIVKMSGTLDIAKAGLGANGFGDASFVHLSMLGAFIVEVVMTAVFVWVILGVTSNNKTSHMGGLVIGLTLALIHILGIPLTGTSVNPARSFGPALVLGGVPLQQVWVFIAAPLVGAVIAAVLYKAINGNKAAIK